MVDLRSPCRRHGRLLGIGAYRPRQLVDNARICTVLDSTEEWIEQRSGIRSRRFASADETLPMMGAAALTRALSDARLGAGQIDCLLVATTTDLIQLPALAVRVCNELGIDGGAFDVLGACAGFCHAVGLANDMVSTGQADRVAVVGVERLTDVIDHTDRSIAFLLGDGAGAVVVGASERPAIGPTVRGLSLGTTGALSMTAPWDDGPRPVMTMDGRRVFRWAVDDGVLACRRALHEAGIGVDDLCAFVPHQANLRIIEILAARLGLPGHVVVARDVVVNGNTSAASIPLAMAALRDEDAMASGGPALLFGFGAGLNHAAQVVLLP